MLIALVAVAALASLIACVLSGLALQAARASAASSELPDSLARLVREAFRDGRDEDRAAHKTHVEALDARLKSFGEGHERQLSGLRSESATGREQAEAALKRNVDSFAAVQREKLDDTAKAMGELAARLERQQEGARNSQREALDAASTAQKEALDRVNSRIEALLQENERRQQAIQQTLSERLDQLRTDNEAKLEQMRRTVDEQLQGTLEKRLGESFQLVSDRLDKVHAGLGEMQTLATGVGDLKRVLTNVKARGGWGELRLGQLLEDMLTPDQYESQVAVRAGAGERVDFAVKLPGRSDDGAPVWLPIDCKFPHEDYERLQAAQERGDPAEVEACAAALERAVRTQAKSIAQKYVHPPQTTNFAILYLPTEGLYAEVIRRPGVMGDLQSAGGVMITGPTTLAAMLNSLQMGFKSLAVEKRSADVWKVLGEAKAEFRKYGEVWGKLGEKLDQAKGLHDAVAVRSRAVERKLRGVEALEVEAGPAALALVAPEEDEAA